MSDPELWGECRRICADCPLETAVTKKENCIHPWRHEVTEHLELSGDGTVSFNLPELCQALGATVSKVLLDNGARPSIQLFDQEPAERLGYMRFRIQKN